MEEGEKKKGWYWGMEKGKGDWSKKGEELLIEKGEKGIRNEERDKNG